MEVEILTSLVTERLGNRLWVLVLPFGIRVDGEVYVVPAGFVFDGASCPRPLWNICAPVAGPFGEGAVAHDWFYDDEGPDIGRLKADQVLYELGRLRGAGLARAQAVKAGVNLFGGSHYKKGGEKLTLESCYDLDHARLRVAELRWSPLEERQRAAA